MLKEPTIKRLAKQLKIDTFTVQREYLQLLFLKYFYTEKETAKVFFKGGTAIRLLFGSFRFSEDLDFTSLLKEKELKELALRSLDRISREESAKLMFKQEISIAGTFRARIFQEVEGLKNPLTVRLDFSIREKPFSTDVNLIETVFPIGPYPQVSHLKAEEVLAEKIRAVLMRVRGRDIFDLWFLLTKQVPINWQLVNKKMSLYKKKTSPEQLIKKIKTLSQEAIKSDLAKFLPESHRNLTEKIKELTLAKL